MAPVKVRMDPDQDLRSLSAALSEARTGLAIVEVEGGGVITERDVLRAIAEGADLGTARVGDWMTPEPVGVETSATVAEACDLMIGRGVRHLLVREGDDLVGVLNMRDVVGVLTGAAELGAVPPARGS
jgi:CBS domain-containing protein